MPINHTAAGKRPFYKYAAPDTALAILKSGKVRYNSPLRFNDPFDIQSGLHFSFDLNTLQGKVLDRLQQLASSPDEPAVDYDDIWGKIVLAAREHYPRNGFPRERWEQFSRPSFNQIKEIIADTQRKYQAHWHQVLLPQSRVFCVSEDPSNLLMWAHYARDHSGCVFEFWSLPEEDNPLSVARPITYVDTPPPFFTEQEWLDDFMGIKKLDFSNLYSQYAYAKSKHWSYEREWRVWYPLPQSSTPYDDIPIRPTELRAMYLGCKASAPFSEEAIALFRQIYPTARVYQATKREGAYELQYSEI